MKNFPGTFSLPILAAAALLSGAQAASAQQDVMRDVYRFQGSALEVSVATETAGRIQLIRGQRSRVEVAGRAPDGFTSAALGGAGIRRLTLSALASGPVDFIVSVPEDVRVRVVWQGSNRSELFGPLAHSATFSWDRLVERPSIETFGSSAHARSSVATAAGIPRVIDIRSAHRLDRLSVHVGEPAFAFSGAQRDAARRAGDVMILDATTNSDLAIDVPAGQSMTLRLDGVDAIVIDGSGVRVLCESVLSQSLRDGRQWLTLTPVPGEGCSGSRARPAPPPATAALRRT
jgi:hypothetical protein